MYEWNRLEKPVVTGYDMALCSSNYILLSPSLTSNAPQELLQWVRVLNPKIDPGDASLVYPFASCSIGSLASFIEGKALCLSVSPITQHVFCCLPKARAQQSF